ncbi:hypothetical protein BBBOND_0313550 [Babesia bigemina]|uniref:Uncharacterized protein n=1 Tax=Babesia bigemina TaxID=5866 RepID=A0A061DA83_BABBI|nr:hypothetical protein BBBOND_0313550 [Babesia bigemina]CDR97453.1 hypothetical protein BBBOND_0313550 [Babesia bigemina]|eukprot:XP_012769639.1 hypothetical protein BBBOND_0313550 [Babesia bigemina]
MNYGGKACFLLFTVAWLGVTANAVWYCVTLKWAFDAPADCFGRGLDSFGKCLPFPRPAKPAKGTIPSPGGLGTDTYKGLEQKPAKAKPLEGQESVTKNVKEEKTLHPVPLPEKEKLPEGGGGESHDQGHEGKIEATHVIPDPLEKTLESPEAVPKVIPEPAVKKPAQGKQKKKKEKTPRRSVRPDGLGDDWD